MGWNRGWHSLCDCRFHGTAAWFQGCEVIDMLLTRHFFAVPLFGDLTRTRGDRLVERGIVPESADRVVPRSDFLFGRQLHGVWRQPLGNRPHESAAAREEISADHVRQ